MKNEIWKDCYGYEGLYQVSNMGRMWSIKSQRTFIGCPSVKGYMKTTLRGKNGKVKTELVHRLVLLTFAGPSEDPERTQVNHIDENKANNRLDNLEWVTAKENCNHGTRSQRVGEQHRKVISQYTMDGKWIATYCSITEATAQTSINHGNISACARGERRSAGGYTWRYGDAANKLKDK